MNQQKIFTDRDLQYTPAEGVLRDHLQRSIPEQATSVLKSHTWTYQECPTIQNSLCSMGRVLVPL